MGPVFVQIVQILQILFSHDQCYILCLSLLVQMHMTTFQPLMQDQTPEQI